MPRQTFEPTSKTCPVCSSIFLVGGRGRPRRSAVYCTRRCLGLATAKNLPAERGSHAPRPKKNRDTLHSEAWLTQRYLAEQQSTLAIARELGCSQPTVRWALDKFGIPMRPADVARRMVTPEPVEWTPEMRESLAAQRRGEANPFFGQPSPNRGPNYHDDPRLRAIRHKRASKYGITGAQYDAMLQAQGRVCAVCGRPETRVARNGTPFTLPVDHDHATGKVRGLLCSNCNFALGAVNDSIAVLRGLIAYLERHSD